MKKILLAVLAAALFVAPVFAEDDDFITVKVDGNIFVQGGGRSYTKADDNRELAKASYQRGTDALYAVGVNFSKEFTNGGIAVLNVKGGNGKAEGLFGGNDATHNTDSSFIRITELSYQQSILDGWSTVKFGRIGTIGGENAIAGSADTQFINPMFTGEATKVGPSNGDEADGYGIQLKVSPLAFLDLQYQYEAPGDANVSRLDRNGWNGFQATVKVAETGNYRLLYWKSNDHIDYLDSDNKPQSAGLTGLSVSADQEIVSGISLFTRFGMSLAPKEILTSFDYIAKQDDSGKYFVSRNISRTAKQAYSLGVQFSGSLWSREGDLLGLAAGRKVFEKFPNPYKESKKEDLTPSSYISELYYNFKINDFISVTPSVQYIINENFYLADIDTTDGTFAKYYAPKSEFALAIRTHISF